MKYATSYCKRQRELYTTSLLSQPVSEILLSIYCEVVDCECLFHNIVYSSEVLSRVSFMPTKLACMKSFS